MAPSGPAIRIRGLGCYFGLRLEMDGVNRPREAFRSLMRIAGINPRAADAGAQVTFAVAGHVLRDVSLDVEWGDVVCLVGPSGSGKSVLLKILAGVLPPMDGRVEFYAAPRHLLSIGDNLDPRKSAFDNLRDLPRTSRESLDDPSGSFDEVIAFAELQGFEHAPIRTFSTGMVLRLSVAMALCGRPSIILVDDVLSVGDIAFRQKCLDRVLALKESGCTMVLAFSDETVVQRLATRVVTLGGGRIVSDVPPLHWLAQSRQGSAANVAWEVLQALPEDDVMALRSVLVNSAPDGQLELRAAFGPKVDGLRCRPLVSVSTLGSRVTVLFRSLYPEFVEARGTETLCFTVPVPTAMLPNGDYSIGFHVVSIEAGTVHAMKASDAVKLSIRRDDDPTAEMDPKPLLLPALPWEVERLAERA